MQCALLLDRVEDVVSQVHNSFAEAIKDQTKAALHQHVLLSLDKAVTSEQERQLEGAKYKDVCAQLHEEYFDACLAPCRGGTRGQNAGLPRDCTPEGQQWPL